MTVLSPIIETVPATKVSPLQKYVAVLRQHLKQESEQELYKLYWKGSVEDYNPIDAAHRFDFGACIEELLVVLFNRAGIPAQRMGHGMSGYDLEVGEERIPVSVKSSASPKACATKMVNVQGNSTSKLKHDTLLWSYHLGGILWIPYASNDIRQGLQHRPDGSTLPVGVARKYKERNFKKRFISTPGLVNSADTPPLGELQTPLQRMCEKRAYVYTS